MELSISLPIAIQTALHRDQAAIVDIVKQAHSGSASPKVSTIADHDVCLATASELDNSSITAAIAGIYQKVQSELTSYLSLRDGWNGYGGKAFDKKSIECVQRIADQVFKFFETQRLAPRNVIPGPAGDGSIDLEIAYNNRSLLLTFFPEKDEMNVYQEEGNQGTEGVSFFDAASVEARLRWLLA